MSKKSAVLMPQTELLYSGRHYVPMDKKLFGMFADSCPDRWGRLLMRRREAEIAREEARKPRKLGESSIPSSPVSTPRT